MRCHVPNDVTNWLEDRQADFQEALAHGDLRNLPELSRMLPEGTRHLAELCFGGVVSSPTIIGQHGEVNVEGDHCLHQCGCVGCRVVTHPTQYRLDRQGGWSTID